MSYSPKHAKQTSLKVAVLGSQHGTFGTDDALDDRHAAADGDARPADRPASPFAPKPRTAPE
ncbi:MAG: hypothetical protein J2P25_11680 [Nocardiopsaceae bacterium]|nr:hypothetical protein [Nocardiopsaceae bacterium]